MSKKGKVIGITGFSFTEGDFGISASSADILPRVRELIAGGDPSGLGDRHVPLGGGELNHQVVLENFWAKRAYVMNESPLTIPIIEFTGDNDGRLTVYDLFGTELLRIDDINSELANLKINVVPIQYDEPVFLVAWQGSEALGNFALRSSHPLMPLHDPDDGRLIQVGNTVQGNIDFPNDRDHFIVHLSEGQIVEILARSAMSDTFLTIDYLGAGDEEIIIDDDSGGGSFGLDSKIVYRAPHTGSYFLVVEDAVLAAPGGYVITIEPADQNATLTTTNRASTFED